ncbi:hypothetical protein C8R45DRAFT_403432 [Mycena sanguinolenta]|nr:hypothetical protein C8R45DRAFT_403432 [Mycena sanguinolenta]
MDYTDDVDVDAEGELELDHAHAAEMTLLDAGGLSAMGVPPPSSTALAASAAGKDSGGVGKRYRPAAAKTFQCRGYGECRMVFSRSEHLARHIRKHTGERPFTCHCSKQFSRLDNLRQHAQTVHADKAAMNEAMMRDLTSLHASMTGGAPATSSGTTTSSAGGTTGAKSKKGSDGGSPDSEDPPAPTPTEAKPATKRPGTKRARASASLVKREASPSPTFSPATGMMGRQRQRPGTSTGYEGAVTVSGRDVNGRDEEMDVDGEPAQNDIAKDEPSPPEGGTRAFRSHTYTAYTPNGEFFRPDGDRFRGPGSAGDGREAGNGFRSGGAHRDSPAGTPNTEQSSFLAPHANAQSHSAGRGESFRGGPQFVRRSPPAHTPSPPTPSYGIPAHRLSGTFSSSGRPFSSGNGAFPSSDSISPAGSSFPAFPLPSSSGSRPSTSNGAPRLPPLSAVVSSSAFRPSSGHGLPGPGASGGILLPNSLTLRRPSTGDWDWGDSWADRPGTAPGKLATASAIVDDSPFSFHPPEQPSSVGYGGGYGGSGNPRKRTLGGPDGPYGAHTDHDEYEYGGSESRPQSRRLSVMELCNERDERPASSSLGLSALRRTGSAERDQRDRERERPTTTNGLVSRASALVLHDGGDHQQQWEHEPRQYAGEQQHFAADYQSAVNGSGLGGWRSAGGVRGADAAASGGAAQAGSRPTTAGGRDGSGSVPSSSAGGGSAFLSSSAAAASAGAGGAAHRGGALSSAAAASAAAGPGAGVSRSLRASPSSPRDGGGYGRDGSGAGDGDDGGISAGSPGDEYGRLSRSPPYRGAGGLTGAGVSGFDFGGGGVPHTRGTSSASASPPSPSRDARARGGGSSSGLPGLALFARVPAYAAAGVQLRGGDDGFRYAGTPGGRAGEVRPVGAGRGPGAPGYEYEYEHEHGHRVGGGRSGGMRV